MHNIHYCNNSTTRTTSSSNMHAYAYSMLCVLLVSTVCIHNILYIIYYAYTVSNSLVARVQCTLVL